jgi:hypothetical protein
MLIKNSSQGSVVQKPIMNQFLQNFYEEYFR